VISVNTFHLLAHPHEVFSEMLRVLNPGGKLVLCDLSPRGFRIFGQLQQLEGRTPLPLKHGLAELAQLLRQRGLKIKRFRGCNQEIFVGFAPG